MMGPVFDEGGSATTLALQETTRRRPQAAQKEA
jgi:hypothetical protein